MASTKTATVNVRIQEDVKQQAEQILSTIGVPRATAIDMFYRQIILHRGIPFELALPQGLPVQEDLSKAELDQLLPLAMRKLALATLSLPTSFSPH